MKFKDTGILHKITYRTSYCFTAFVLLFSSVTYITANDTQPVWIPSVTMLFTILLFSFFYALSFLIFDVKKLGNTPKRIIHIILNYLNVWICFFLIPGNISAIKAFIIVTFIYAVLYTVIAGINALIMNAKEKLR